MNQIRVKVRKGHALREQVRNACPFLAFLGTLSLAHCRLLRFVQLLSKPARI
jgi:hypothetical protein